MKNRMPRLGASLLAIGLAIGTITGGLALSASAAPANPDQQVVASFQGRPDAAILNAAAPGGAVYTIDKIPEGATVGLEVAVERVSAPGTFEVIRAAFPQAISGGTTNAIINADTLSGAPLATGDRLRFTYTVGAATTVNYYVLPATASGNLAPVVTTTGDFTAATAFGAGIPVTFSNLDTQKVLTIITSVSRNVNGSFTPQAVITRTYVQPSEFPSGTYTTNLRAFNELDTDLPLSTGDSVSIEAQSGICCGNFQGFAFETLVAATVDPPTPTTPAGEFSPAAPTAAQFLAGVEYNFTGLDNTVTNVARLYAATAAAPTVFTAIGTVPIDASDITAGASTISVEAYYAGTPNTALNAGDVVQVRLEVDSEPGVVLTTYVIPGAVVDPPVPGAPAGSFSTAAPTAAQLFDGVPYTITNLDDTAVNSALVYIKKADGSFVLFDTTAIDAADIVDGEFTFNVFAYTDGGVDVAPVPLEAGDTVEVRLVVDGDESVLTTYVLAAVVPGDGDGDGDGDGTGTGDGDGGNLAQTGTADDRAIQNAGLFIIGGGLTLGFVLMGVVLMRRRNEAKLDLVA